MRQVKFDSVRVAEVTIKLLETPALITAKAAFVSTTSGATHGWTQCTHWSPETLEKLRELRELMERDLSAMHFVDGVGGTATTSSSGMRDAFQGLGEHLGTAGETVPQG